MSCEKFLKECWEFFEVYWLTFERFKAFQKKRSRKKLLHFWWQQVKLFSKLFIQLKKLWSILKILRSFSIIFIKQKALDFQWKFIKFRKAFHSIDKALISFNNSKKPFNENEPSSKKLSSKKILFNKFASKSIFNRNFLSSTHFQFSF